MKLNFTLDTFTHQRIASQKAKASARHFDDAAQQVRGIIAAIGKRGDLFAQHYVACVRIIVARANIHANANAKGYNVALDCVHQ